MNHSFFNIINNERKAYWLGMLMADGCVYRKGYHNIVILALKNEDSYHLNNFKVDIDCDNNIYSHNSGSSKQLRIYSKKMCDDLEKIGCTQRKSLSLQFPELDESLLPHFIRGYFDGDGSAYLVAQKFLACKFVGTYGFLSSLNDVFIENEISNRPIEKTFSGNAYHLRYQKNADVRSIYNFMYSNSTISLDRKKLIFGGYYNSSNLR